MRCKICGEHEFDNSGPICKQCQVGISVLNIFIDDLEKYLSSADKERLEEYYSENISYFVSVLSGYNRYVSVKNVVQEVAMLYITSEPDEIFYSQDIDNNEPLRDSKTREMLSKNGLFSSEYDDSRNDFKIVIGEKISISRYVLDNFGLNGSGFTNYFNSLLLYSMLGLIKEDINSWENGDQRKFPRRGFFPVRLMASPIMRALLGKSDKHFITSEEMIRALKSLTVKGQIKALSQIMGIEFQSKSIFQQLPDPDNEDEQNYFTGEFSKMIDHFVERIRERAIDRQNIR